MLFTKVKWTFFCGPLLHLPLSFYSGYLLFKQTLLYIVENKKGESSQVSQFNLSIQPQLHFSSQTATWRLVTILKKSHLSVAIFSILVGQGSFISTAFLFLAYVYKSFATLLGPS